MRILVTNDDGIDSQGLQVLAKALSDLGDIVVVAPDREFSGASAALGPLHLIQPEARRVRLDGVDEAWAVSGPPALCVTFARLGAFGPPVELVVAGINPGANVGRSVYHSGTVGAALTARMRGVSGVAVSQAVKGFGVEGQGWDEMIEDQHWETAAAVARPVVAALLDVPGGEPVVVNLNVPNIEGDRVRGWLGTTLSSRSTRSIAAVSLEPKAGHPGSFRVRTDWSESISLPPETDGGAVERDYVSLTMLGPLGEEKPDRAPGVVAALDGLFSKR